MMKKYDNRQTIKIDWVETARNSAIFLVSFILLFLFSSNMEGNEVDLLPLARQFSNHSWIPSDWYLNQPPSYRYLFQLTFGSIASKFGFLFTSIFGRLISYIPLSIGLGMITSAIRMNVICMPIFILINLKFHEYRGAVPDAGSYYSGLIDLWIGRDISNVLILILTIIFAGITLLRIYKKRKYFGTLLLTLTFLLFMADNRPYSIVANEWYVGGLEAKAIAYSLVFLGIGFAIHRRNLIPAIFFGLATSYHVLAGGYAAINYFLYIVFFERSSDLKNLLRNKLLPTLATYLLCSAFAIEPVVKQILSGLETQELSNINILASRIYVYIRLPHHLNPDFWPNHWPVNFLVYITVILFSYFYVRKSLGTSIFAKDDLFGDGGSSNEDTLKAKYSSKFLFGFSILSLIPFCIGLLTYKFDVDGSILQYYPFRFGDVILPFSTSIMYLLYLQGWVASLERKKSLLIRLFLILMISIFVIPEAKAFTSRMASLRSFPNINEDERELVEWAHLNSSSEDIFLTPPAGLENFTWLSERGTIVNFKMFPQSKSGIYEWTSRMTDLMGGSQSWMEFNKNKFSSTFSSFLREVFNRYGSLSSDYVMDLMNKYNSRFFVTFKEHKEIHLPRVFQNDKYVVYTNNGALPDARVNARINEN